MTPFLIFLSGIATAMLLLLLGYVILCAMCVSGDKANDSEHSDL